MRWWLPGLVLGAAVVGCSGPSAGDQTARVGYSRVVSFGDSLSDVGTYRVSTIAAVGGGEYTVNDPVNNPMGGLNWTELLATQVGATAPCPAMTGLQSVIPQIPAAAIMTYADCYNYAQGGARVTNPVGPGNIALWLGLGDTSGQLGQLTVPVVTQINNFLTAHGSFASDDLVTVFAGGNDVFINLATLQATIAGGGDATAAVTAAVTAMGTAGAEEAGYITQLILPAGAKHVVVVNIPDVSVTPLGIGLGAQTQAIIQMMVEAFNQQLAAGLAGHTDTVLQVDLYTQSQQEHADPDQYGLTEVDTPACDLTDSRGQTTPGAELLAGVPTSLLCTTGTTLATDVSRYEYADTVHPTPYAYSLITSLVVTRMAQNGWL